MDQQEARSFIGFIQHLNKAIQYCNSYIADLKRNPFSQVMHRQRKKLETIKNDMASSSNWDIYTLKGMNQEFDSDAFEVDAIMEKVSILPTDIRQVLEEFLDDVVNDRIGITNTINILNTRPNFENQK